MPPLHLFVHADSPENAARIEQALRAGDPDLRIRVVADPAALPPNVLQAKANGLVSVLPGSGGSPAPAPQPGMTSAIRHELNNQLGLIRMLADFLLVENTLPPAAAAKVREIGSAAEAAAQTVRRTKPPA